MSTTSVWLAFELDGEIEEVEVQVSESTTVAQLRQQVFTSNLFPLPHGITPRDVALARDEPMSSSAATRLRALKLTDVVAQVAAPPKNALTVVLMRGSYVVSSRGSFVRANRDVLDAGEATSGDTNDSLERAWSKASEWAETEHSLRQARPAVRWLHDVIADKWQQTASLVTVDATTRVWRDLAVPGLQWTARWGADVSEAVALGEARARAVALHWATLMTVALAGDSSLVPRVRRLDAWQIVADGAWYLVDQPPAAATGGGGAAPTKAAVAAALERAAALAHFAFDQTLGRVVVLLEALGVDGAFGDAVVHTDFVDDVSARDKGEAGLKQFAGAHKCGALCKRLALRTFVAIAAEAAASPKSALSASVSGLGDVGGAAGASPTLEQLMALTSGKATPKQPASPRTTQRRSEYAAKAKEARLAAKDDAAKTYTFDASAAPRPGAEFGVLFTLSEHKSCVNALLCHGEHVLSASSDKTVRVWSLKTFECVQTLTGHSQEVTALWRSETHIFSGSQDGSIRCWSLAAPFELRATLNANDDVFGVCTAAGRVFAAAAKNIVWWTQTSDTAFERSRKPLEGHKKTIKALTATGDYLFSGANDKSIRVWDARSLECKYTINDHDGWVTSLFIHDKLLYSCAYDSLIKVWDLTTLTCVRTIKNAQRVESATVWQDHVFAGTEDARIWVYPLGSVESVATLKEHKLAVLALAASPDLLFSGSYDGTIKVWGQTNFD